MSDRIEALVEEFLSLALRGETMDLRRFLEERVQLTDDERDRVRALVELFGATLGSPAAPSIPASIAHYRVLAEVGRGAQSVVYLAQDTRLSRRVALKILAHRPDLGSGAGRLRREAEITSKLDHPNICIVHEIGEVDGRPFLAMRYVEGETLAQRIARSKAAKADVVDLATRAAPGDGTTSSVASSASRRRGIVRCLEVVEQAARALHSAHVAGVIHRDVKPANIMIGPNGEPVLLDFGLARQEESDALPLTVSGELVGSPAYMSPEQVAPESRTLDRRTDVYSLGVVLYECLTLRRPFEAPTREALYRKILSDPPPDPRKINPDLDRDLVVVLDTALEKDTERRYASALAFAEDLRRIREFEPILARPAGPMLRLRRWMQRNPWPVAAGAAAVLAASLLGYQALHDFEAERKRKLGEALDAAYREIETKDDTEAGIARFAALVAECRRIDANNELVHDLGLALEQRQRGYRALAYYQAAARRIGECETQAVALTPGAPPAAFEAIDETFASAREELEQSLQVDPASRGSTALWRRLRAARESADRVASERAAASGPSLRITGSPAGAEIFLFEYVLQSQLEKGGDPRLVPVPASPAGGGTIRASGAGDLALEVEDVLRGSPAEQAGLKRGDLILRIAGRRVDAAAVALSDSEVGGSLAGTVRAFDRVARLGDRKAPTAFQARVIAGRMREGEAIEAEFASARGAVERRVEKHGTALSIPLGTVRDAVDRAQPLHALELEVLSDGVARTVTLNGAATSGATTRTTANPLVCGAGNLAGKLPDCAIDLRPSSYLLVLRAARCEDLRLPVAVSSAGARTVRADLLPEGTTPPGFVYVPPGRCVVGADGQPDPLFARQELWIDGFWISRTEVTVAEYRRFLDSPVAREALADGEASRTYIRLPRTRLVDAPGRPLCRPRWPVDERGAIDDRGWDPEEPMWSLACEDMDAYCEWLTAEGQGRGSPWYFRLPTEDEWEKAARGADGRKYPWGDEARRGFCKCGGPDFRAGFESLLDEELLEPAGSYPIDESPFGVRDMEGSLIEHCAGPPIRDTPFARAWRGGNAHLSWTEPGELVDCTVRNDGLWYRPGDNDGFRVVAWRKPRRTD